MKEADVQDHPPHRPAYWPLALLSCRRFQLNYPSAHDSREI